jgi:hypothetical protein
VWNVLLLSVVTPLLFPFVVFDCVFICFSYWGNSDLIGCLEELALLLFFRNSLKRIDLHSSVSVREGSVVKPADPGTSFDGRHFPTDWITSLSYACKTHHSFLIVDIQNYLHDLNSGGQLKVRVLKPAFRPSFRFSAKCSHPWIVTELHVDIL